MTSSLSSASFCLCIYLYIIIFFFKTSGQFVWILFSLHLNDSQAFACIRVCFKWVEMANGRRLNDFLNFPFLGAGFCCFGDKQKEGKMKEAVI